MQKKSRYKIILNLILCAECHKLDPLSWLWRLKIIGQAKESPTI